MLIMIQMKIVERSKHNEKMKRKKKEADVSKRRTTLKRETERNEPLLK
jgi:hypothetical protein